MWFLMGCFFSVISPLSLFCHSCCFLCLQSLRYVEFIRFLSPNLLTQQNMKKFLLALVIGFLIGSPAGFALGELFSDVEPSAWYASAVESLTEKRIIAGYPDGTYGPSNYVNRAELAVVLDRMLDYMEDGVVVLEGDYVLDEVLLEERRKSSKNSELLERAETIPEEWSRLTVFLDIGEPGFEQVLIDHDLPASVDQEFRIKEAKDLFLNDLELYDLKSIVDYEHFPDLSFEIQNKYIAQVIGHPKFGVIFDSLNPADYQRVVSAYGYEVVNKHYSHGELLIQALENPDRNVELEVFFNFPFDPELRRLETEEAIAQESALVELTDAFIASYADNEFIRLSEAGYYWPYVNAHSSNEFVHMLMEDPDVTFVREAVVYSVN